MVAVVVMFSSGIGKTSEIRKSMLKSENQFTVLQDNQRQTSEKLYYYGDD